MCNWIAEKCKTTIVNYKNNTGPSYINKSMETAVVTL